MQFQRTDPASQGKVMSSEEQTATELSTRVGRDLGSPDLTVKRNELSSAAFLGRPADLMAFTLHGSGDTPSLENIKP